MIERELIETALSKPDDFEYWVSGAQMRELCRVYLKVLDAPEGVASIMTDCGMLYAEIDAADDQGFDKSVSTLHSKRVRIVEVGDG